MDLKKKKFVKFISSRIFWGHPLYDMRMDTSQPKQMKYDVRQIRRVRPHQQHYQHLSREVYFVLYQSRFGMFALRIIIRNSFL